jgi:transcriptional antiterminator Rof (Rho-off)
MTDGPFKNLRLDRRSKRFAEAVQNDAVDLETRRAYANDAILNSILRENEALLSALQAYSQDGQFDLVPNISVKGIFDDHPKSEFADHLHREVSFRLDEGQMYQAAINNGLKAALENSIREFKTRTHEACLEARGSGEMRMDQLDRFVVGSNQALESIDRQRMMEALWKCDKGAFKQDVRKKEGLDEGPRM